jgi:hypothetical protein
MSNMQPTKQGDKMEFPVGTRVLFGDANATVSDSLAGTRIGIVNGDPICDDNGAIKYYCVWADRDNGREATTIFVAAPNLLGLAGRFPDA